MSYRVWMFAWIFLLLLPGCRTRCCPECTTPLPALDECAMYSDHSRLARRLWDLTAYRTYQWTDRHTAPAPKEKDGDEHRAAPSEAGASPSACGDRRLPPGWVEPPFHPSEHPTILALSGGALNGAFGAGFVNGWRKAGNRPRFDIITGVSSGALQAPLVFLDDDWGAQQLEHYFTSYGGDEILTERCPLSLPFSSSTHMPDGLTCLLARLVTADFLKRLVDAAALPDGHGAERQLLVGTVELDTGTFYVWDMIAIARAGNVQRFRDVLLASASAPPIYPPVMIDGRPHMDGGCRQQVFVPCLAHAVQTLQCQVRRTLLNLDAAPEAGRLETALRRPLPPHPPLPAYQPLPPVKPVLYLVINSYVGMRVHCTQPQILDVGVRSVDCLCDEALYGCAWKAWGLLQRALEEPCSCDDCYHIVSMPRAYAHATAGSQALEKGFVRELYLKGRADGEVGKGWYHDPTGLMKDRPGVVVR